MPFSSAEGRPFVVQYCSARGLGAVLDIGPGAGAWAVALAPVVRGPFIGIEIFQPYLDRYRLAEFYDELIVADALTVDWPAVDLVILGDVLEHVSHSQAPVLWAKARAAAAVAVVLSVPIHGYEQGPWEGNEHEAHLHQWSHQTVLAELEGVTLSWQGDVVGVYIAETGSRA